MGVRVEDTTLDAYQAFLRAKMITAPSQGIPCDPTALSDALFPFQQAIVAWAVQRGKAAIWASTGLGKTRMSLAWAQQLQVPTLMLAPLAVAPQTIDEARVLGVDVAYVRSMDDVRQAGTPYVITNYDMLAHMNATAFHAVILDESSILKSFSGATKKQLLTLFADTPYRLACTATPAPNDHMELGNHAEFLGIMPSNEMLSRWFINDTMHAGAYRLKAHAAADFWRWITSWAVCCTLPSDIDPRYDDTLYHLPPLEIRTHHVALDPSKAFARGQLFYDETLSATTLWGDKRATLVERCQKAAAIVNAAPEHSWLVWCHTDAESSLLTSLIPDASEVRGSHPRQIKEHRLAAFREGQSRILVTKPDLAGWGLNLQRCADVVFVGLTYSYEQLYQALRRTWRFGQTQPVTAHIIAAESEHHIQKTLERKYQEHAQMQEAMIAATRQYGIRHSESLTRTLPVPQRHEGPSYTLYEGDCVQSMAALQDDSVHLTITSVPFSNLYIYSDSLADMGNSKDHHEFFAHMDFLISELLRVTKPGRLCCVHCKDLPLYMNRDNAAGLYDFPGNLVRHFVEGGWTFHSRVTIWKDPVTEMQRTKNHGLLHKNFASRREVCRQGMADYVLVFRAWKGDISDKQISHAPEPGSFIGEEPPTSYRDSRDYSIQVWQRYASPVWFDIRQQRVIDYREARSEDDAKHICPLQLDVIERCLWLWSNPREMILDPFAGICSTGYVALQEDRQFIGCELKPEYCQTGLKNLEAALASKKQLALL